jgi:hypothetical protein
MNGLLIITYKISQICGFTVSLTTQKSFVEYYYGKEAGFEYVRGIRKNIQNDKPIIGHYNVNNEGSSDMY